MKTSDQVLVTMYISQRIVGTVPSQSVIARVLDVSRGCVHGHVNRLSQAGATYAPYASVWVLTEAGERVARTLMRDNLAEANWIRNRLSEEIKQR